MDFTKDVWTRDALDQLEADLVAAMPAEMAGDARLAVSDAGNIWRPVAEEYFRGGLIGGQAWGLEGLPDHADLLERQAAAIRRLVAHVEATHPLARRRARDRRARQAVSA